MKKNLILFLFLFCFSSIAFAQIGTWSGELEVMGTKIPLVFHLDDDESTVDSPAQGAKGIPILVERREGGEVNISVPMIGASFEGKYEDGKISGTFKQNGLSLPLTLSPGEEKPKRPQTPCPPFSYSEEEVSFINNDAVLKGTLTLPKDYSQDTPVVIMVTGSGLQNRDEEIFEHKPFAVIADALANAGIASLRYDDRGFGESTGDAVNCTTEDLKNDALSGIGFLRKRFNRVGVLGHSEGGTIAVMLAADKKPDFIISLAGMIISGKETLIDQNRIALTEAGYPESTVKNYCRILSMIFDNDESAEQAMENSSLPVALKKNLQVVAEQIKSPYMQYFLNTDLRNQLGMIDCPVLALNGTKDTQVSYKSNLDALTEGLNPNKRNSIQSIEGLNHLFQHCTTGSIKEYAIIEETISPEVLSIITDWILSL